MQNLNSIQMIGGVVREPEVREVSNTFVAKITLAVTTRHKTKEGYKDEVCYVDVTVWGNKAQNAKGLRKGQRIFVNGRLKQEKWIDKKTNQEKTKFVIMADNFVHEGELGTDMTIEETEATKLYNAPDNKAPKDPFKAKEQAPAGRTYKSAPVEDEYADSDLPF